MQKIVCSFLLGMVSFANAQYSARFVVTDIATRKNEDIYLSGNFNSWNPKDENYKLKPFGGNRKSIVLKDLAKGTYVFKFSRGENKLECTSDGREIPDRQLEVNGDISNEYSIAGWKDDYPDRPKTYTASPQVRIIDTAFFIPQLNRKRRIWIYLPKGYANVGKAYPVLYMHDGQNLFNDKTAFTGEWGVDECLDTLQSKIGKECIVVGIDNGGDKRMNEYNPYDHFQYGKGEGKAYAAFIATTLKPFIDAKYRTRKGRDYTFIAGSSMGALISWYTVQQYPDIFAGAGVLSPSFWVSPQIAVDATLFNPDLIPKFYFYVGEKESGNMVADMQKIAGILQKKPKIQIRTVVNPLGQHNEIYWRKEFPDFFKWMANSW
ncbi:MAG: phosphonate ABC transporter ATP-binding protein [Sphingobacteriia bacterium]|nr:MAG: phosphonate ABC transporter ATP-binding protein [Sphingobacteriia bacterium]TAG30513.1 MAG: phosphonate ABC transporter ATP-binding protein [Sphingobacteriia bacterium]TAH08519.1 MAG: phosphonate ABC transporter ATP-binding protein [Sphingobacteriia bacterium]